MADVGILGPLFGGALIGAASVLLMLVSGRIAGISGIAAGLLPPASDANTGARIAFILGLVAAPVVWQASSGDLPGLVVEAGPAVLIGAGLLVGFGAVWGSGCTSGHGVCGLSRLSKRSFAAVATFMAAAIATVFLWRHVL